MKNNNLEPILTLSSLYGPNVIYTARPSYESNPWLSIEEHQANFSTGRELIIADQMPVIVHEASVTNKLIELLNSANINPTLNVLKFRDRQTYEKILEKSTYQDNKKIFFQYPHHSSIVNDTHYVVNKDTLLKLNNKSFLSELTGGKYLPKREIMKINNFEQAISKWDFPFVLKPGGDSPTSGGYGVMICYNSEDLTKAKEKLFKTTDITDTVIIEQKIEEKYNFSVQYACSSEKGIIYLGATEQLTDNYGYYKGNHNAPNVPLKVIQAGKEIMQIGLQNGYVGIAGFDLLVDKHNDIYAIDLNFRQNGSTSMLLLEPLLTEGYHKFYNYLSNIENERFFSFVLKYVRKGVLFPLAYYDGDWFQNEIVSSRFCGIWHGTDKNYVEEMEQQFLKEIESN
ncbi:L-aspartate--L-methionine ligase LdmS [Staphylococcus gallinarum]|uniref:L-aspartate--L-methionine ligase LdmS n=1 Tax=Staphylococcus gallinarum TaxID=1293 RepID=UPI001E33C0C4|nr:ATP-grasp domain-containing protein [Staphylococcus gallinarum]MCD8787442.1 ATP-grasp domain-containing protein [Staphylococcus gallinarum]MCD8845249.1 ATP-grasp domain-containing protein [Staphylococcus gallinarum]